jgi:hypothetical protein
MPRYMSRVLIFDARYLKMRDIKLQKADFI